jgi:hypothetical protein
LYFSAILSHFCVSPCFSSFLVLPYVVSYLLRKLSFTESGGECFFSAVLITIFDGHIGLYRFNEVI